MIRRPPRSTQSRSSAASDVYKRQSPTIVGVALMMMMLMKANASRVLYGRHVAGNFPSSLNSPSHCEQNQPLSTRPRKACSNTSRITDDSFSILAAYQHRGMPQPARTVAARSTRHFATANVGRTNSAQFFDASINSLCTAAYVVIPADRFHALNVTLRTYC